MENGTILCIMKPYMYLNKRVFEKNVEKSAAQTFFMGQLAHWLEYLTPDQEDISSISGRDRTCQSSWGQVFYIGDPDVIFLA